MDYKDVRIGNWVNEQGLHLQVGIINIEVLKSAEPILLDFEWALKLGLSYSEEEEIFYIEPGYFEIQYWTHCKEFHYIANHGSLDTKITYVHQLQNLYYILCGEELVKK